MIILKIAIDTGTWYLKCKYCCYSICPIPTEVQERGFFMKNVMVAY